MGIFTPADKHRVPRLDFELTPGCDHKCAHCYNVWTADPQDPQGAYPRDGQLRGQAYLDMMRKAVEQSGAEHITITGGEPLLHPEAMQIIELACSLVPSVQMISNGSHISPERAKKFAEWGLRSLQLTLLAADRETHDRLKGAVCFDDTVRAALDLKDAGVPVQVCFVAMKENWREFEAVIELCSVLGVRGISYNRMSPTGGGVHHIERLLPLADQIEHNLDTAERLGAALRIPVATAMPVPPCLVRIERYKWVKFGFCSVGTESPNIAIDARGRVRSCNLSAHVMGDITAQDWPDIHSDPYLHTFKDQVPEMCRGCAYERSCQGGCKESAFATYGALDHPEPLPVNVT